MAESHDIYKVSSDGSHETQLTSNTNNEGRYKWSPDNTRIIYDKDNTNGWFNVWIMNTDGSMQTNLTNNPQSLYCVWSPDGTKIAYVYGDDFDRPLDLTIMNPDGSNKQIIATGQPSYGTLIAWSPDASKIVFSSGAAGSRGIRVVNANGTSLMAIANGDIRTQTQSWQAQVWSPDGSRIVYNSDEDGNYDIYTINANGTGKTQLTTDTSDDRHAYFSPDGSKILFVSDRTGNNDIWVMDADGSSKVQLTTNTSDDITPSWSPDGSKIAFQSDRSGNYDIWVMKLGEISIAATIDIKPGSDSNCFNNDGHGVIPVAILSDCIDGCIPKDGFDATQVDPETVQIEGMAVRAVGKKDKLQAHIEDVNNDGCDDLVVQIVDQGGAFDGGETEATLTGNLYDVYGGTAIEGTDTICIVP